MGDPKKQRKKYSGPTHPWQRTRLEAEKILKEEYGLKNKKELWKMNSLLSKYKAQTKSLITATGEQANKEKKLFLDKLVKFKLMQPGSEIEDVLNLTIKDILERRLQTVIFRLGLAKTIKQARQFITHGHVVINNTKITIPSYLVPGVEENVIIFSSFSALADEEHPERKLPEAIVEKIEEVKKIDVVEEEKPTEEKKENKE